MGRESVINFRNETIRRLTYTLLLLVYSHSYLHVYVHDVYDHTGHISQSSIEHFMLYEQGPLIVNNNRTLCTGVTEVFPSQPSALE